jgi:hypothetical protein
MSRSRRSRTATSKCLNRRNIWCFARSLPQPHSWVVSTDFGHPARFGRYAHGSGRRWAMPTESKKQIGGRAEDLACAELERQGYRCSSRIGAAGMLQHTHKTSSRSADCAYETQPRFGKPLVYVPGTGRVNVAILRRPLPGPAIQTDLLASREPPNDYAHQEGPAAATKSA